MEERTSHGTDEQQARLRGHERGGDGNGQSRRREDAARSSEENLEQGRRASESVAEAAEQVQDLARRTVEEAGAELPYLQRAWTDAGAMAFGTAADFVLSWQKELGDFLSERIEKDLEFGRRLWDARDPGTLLRLNTEFGHEMIADYSTYLTDVAKRSASEAQQRGCELLRGAKEAADHLRAGARHAAE